MATVDTIAAALMAAGAAWTLLGVLGLVRFPDVFSRLHGTGLGSTGGIALLLAGVVVHFATRSVTLSVLAGLTLVFVLLTYPLASTAIVSAAHRTRAAGNDVGEVDELGADEGALVEADGCETSAEVEAD